MLIYYISKTIDDDGFIETFKDDLADCNLKLGWTKSLINDFGSNLDPYAIKEFTAFLESAEYLIKNSTKLIDQVKTKEIKE